MFGMKTAEKFFTGLSEFLKSPGVENSCFVLYGEDPYLTKRLKQFLRASELEVLSYEMPKSGPDSQFLDYCAGTSLFGMRNAVFVTKVTSPTSWKKDAHGIWTRILNLLQTGDVKVFLQTASEKAFSHPSFGETSGVRFDIDPSQTLYWIEALNREKGGILDSKKVQFLVQREEDLLTVENHIELWSLGGDLWAEKSLGWGESMGIHKDIQSVENPAYAWVDATLLGRSDKALRLLRVLSAQEPLMLLGLLSKSVKILAQLDSGVQSFKGDLPFLVAKLKKLRNSQDPNKWNFRGRRLLRACAHADRQLKSSRTDPWLVLGRLAQ